MRRSIDGSMGELRKNFRPIESSIRRVKQIAGQLSLVRFFFAKEMNSVKKFQGQNI